MIDQAALGQFIAAVFTPYVPLIIGAITAILLSILAFLFIRDGLFADLEKDNVRNDVP